MKIQSERISVIVEFVLILCVSMEGGAQPNTLSAADRPTLGIVAAGINSRGTAMYDQIKQVTPGSAEATIYRIELEAEGRASSPLGWLQKAVDQGKDQATPDRTIRVKDWTDPRLKSFVQEIARQQHVIVNIDMDLAGLPGGQTSWSDQTNKLAAITEMVAEERQRQMPDSANAILTHSAATVALSQVINDGKGSLFQTKIAASPMTWHLSSDVLILQQVNDLPSTPTGSKFDLLHSDTRSAATDPQGWAYQGNKVIRADWTGFDAAPSSVLQTLREAKWEEAKRSIPIAGGVLVHGDSHELGVRDGRVEVYMGVSHQNPGEPPTPMHVEKFEIGNVSPGKVINVFEGRGGPSQAVPSTDKRFTEYDRLKQEVTKLEPPRGGGIALKAVAQLPLDASRVTGAVWDEAAGQIVLLGRNENERWRLPYMNSEIAKIAYLSVLGPHAADPEVSIGAPLKNVDMEQGSSEKKDVRPARERTGSGRRPVYYSGPIENTLMGVLLLRADQALGKIAYGGSQEIAGLGLDRLHGYHSLPELYPAKYASQPQSNRWLGSQERIVIQSLPGILVAASEHSLKYADAQELAVRFGRTTPAERAYADLFRTYYFSILKKVPELGELVTCSRAVGVFKWLAENKVQFRPDPSWALVAPQRVYTPHHVAPRRAPHLEDLSFNRPLLQFNEYGPTDIFRESGEHIRIEYKRGHVAKIMCGDGRSLETYTDDLGNPVAVEIRGVGAAVFTYAENYILVQPDVKVERVQGRVVGFSISRDSGEFPESNPWGLINIVAQDFIRN